MSWLIIFTLLVSTVLGGGGAAYVSGSALPGDMLYELKTTIEDVRLSLANGEGELLLEGERAQTRLMEIQSLLELDRFEDVNLAQERYQHIIHEIVQERTGLVNGDAVQLETRTAFMNSIYNENMEILNGLLEHVPDQLRLTLQQTIRTTEQLRIDQTEESSNQPENAGWPEEVGTEENAKQSAEQGQPAYTGSSNEAGYTNGNTYQYGQPVDETGNSEDGIQPEIVSQTNNGGQNGTGNGLGSGVSTVSPDGGNPDSLGSSGKPDSLGKGGRVKP